MIDITFNQSWAPNSIPTDAMSATIGIVDNTTQTTVVAPGTAMTRESEGNYAYTYSATEGHSYLATITITGTTGAVGVFQQVAYAQASTTIPASNDDGSTAYIATVWAQQRGIWTNIKNAALAAIAIALSLGEGPSYSISGRLGSESLSMNEFISNMRETAAAATKMEIELTQALQDVGPFDLRQRVGVRQPWGAGGRW